MVGVKEYLVDILKDGYVFNRYTGPDIIAAQEVYEELSCRNAVKEIVLYERTIIDRLCKPLEISETEEL